MEQLISIFLWLGIVVIALFVVRLALPFVLITLGAVTIAGLFLIAGAIDLFHYLARKGRILWSPNPAVKVRGR